MLLNKKDRVTTLGLILLAERYESFLSKVADKLPKDKAKEIEDARKEAMFARSLVIRARPMRQRLEKQIKIRASPEATDAGGRLKQNQETKQEENPNEEV